MSAKYRIVEGDPHAHREEALGLTLRNFDVPPEVTYARYPKYYTESPFGPALVFFAEETMTGQFVGMATLFPIELSVGGEPLRGAIGGDFVVDRPHRVLGPALALQRATVDALDANGLHFVYGLPNQNSDPVTARIGFVDVGQLSRFIKVLRVESLAGKAAQRPLVGRLASTLGPVLVDPILSLISRERLYRRRRDVRAEHVERFDQRFDEVFDAMSRHHPITARRSVELLDWRYEKDHPADRLGGHSILAVVENGARVLGYVVYKTIDGVRYVEDVGFLPSRDAVDAVLSELVLDARRERNAAISVTLLETKSLLVDRLRSFGFLRRPERSRLRVYTRDDSAQAVDFLDRNNWYFLFGDSDI